jgi:hypothetical protein
MASQRDAYEEAEMVRFSVPACVLARRIFVLRMLECSEVAVDAHGGSPC